MSSVSPEDIVTKVIEMPATKSGENSIRVTDSFIQQYIAMPTSPGTYD